MSKSLHTCPNCLGTGDPVESLSADNKTRMLCASCGGTGVIWDYDFLKQQGEEVKKSLELLAKKIHEELEVKMKNNLFKKEEQKIIKELEAIAKDTPQDLVERMNMECEIKCKNCKFFFQAVFGARCRRFPTAVDLRDSASYYWCGEFKPASEYLRFDTTAPPGELG